MSFAEYIWLDGSRPVGQLRSKTRFIELKSDIPSVREFPEWSFDGSSTNQATGSDSDCILKPVAIARDPFRAGQNFLVLCEVYSPEGAPHETNSRAKLRRILAEGAKAHEPWIGFEQEYTLFRNGRPLGFPEAGYPGPQGPYYCSVGADRAFGRAIAEDHAEKCLAAGLLYYGMNAEVMPGQWEFQMGYRGHEGDDPGVLNVADHMWIGRWILHRVAEERGVIVSFENKPMKGDWNGAGMHTNFSTNRTRAANGGLTEIHQAIHRLEKRHEDHIALYGQGLDERLTGLHETCSIHEFKSGTADRGASIRIPLPVEKRGSGYFEDRRPGANADPYLVAARITATVCKIDESDIYSAASGEGLESKAA